MIRILLLSTLLVSSTASFAAEPAIEDFSVASASFKASVRQQFDVSFPALVELLQRSEIDGYDFVDSAEKDKSWPYLQELVQAGYMEISTQHGMGGYMKEREVYVFHLTPKGNALRYTLLSTPPSVKP